MAGLQGNANLGGNANAPPQQQQPVPPQNQPAPQQAPPQQPAVFDPAAAFAALNATLQNLVTALGAPAAQQPAAPQQQQAAPPQPAPGQAIPIVGQGGQVQYGFVTTAGPGQPAFVINPQPPANPTKPPKIATPDRYDGTSQDGCDEFILNCEIYFEHNYASFANDTQAISWAISYLGGRAHRWAQPILRTLRTAQPAPEALYWVDFRQALNAAYGDPDRAGKAERQLRNLRQTTSASAYTSEFERLRMDLNWDNDALIAHYKQGLKVEIVTAKVNTVWPTVLRQVQQEAIRVDNELYAIRQQYRQPRQPQNPPPQQQYQRQQGFAQYNQRPQQFAPPVNQQQQQQQRPQQGVQQQRPPQPQGGAPRQPPPPQFQQYRNPPPPAGMVVDGAGRRRITDAERQRRRQAGLCMRCGQAGHFVANCPTGGMAVRGADVGQGQGQGMWEGFIQEAQAQGAGQGRDGNDAAGVQADGAAAGPAQQEN